MKHTLTSWLTGFAVYKHPAALRMLLLGFSAGLPLLLVLGSLSFWLREAGVNRSTIGYLSWVGLAYGFKWLWSPLVDRLPLPLLRRLGRRRSWLLLAQAAIVVGLVGMALTDPKVNLTALVWFAVLVAFASATQDVALDAYRIESASAELQAALAAAYTTGYRISMIWAGAGVLWLAARAEVANAANYQHAAWQFAYLVMAASMAVGVLAVWFSPEPYTAPQPPSRSAMDWVHFAVVAPFASFIQRYRWQAVWILGLIAVYRISDIVMGVMANPFYVDMGYTKDQVAGITKVYGIVMTLLGTLIGGVVALRVGVLRVLLLGAVLSSASNLLFAWLAQLHVPGQAPSVWALTFVISADNLSAGLASAAFIAYLSSLTQVQYSATQYALFSSLMVLAPKWLAGFSGKFVDTFGYSQFFNTTALLGIPVVVLIVWLMRKEGAGTRA